jgi:hypothetical protein
MIPTQSLLPPQDGPARGPVLGKMQVLQDSPAPKGSGPPGNFAGVMSQQPPESGDLEGLDHPSAPDQTAENRDGETISAGVSVSEGSQLERGADAPRLSDGSVRSPAAETRPAENRLDGKGRDPAEAAVKPPEAGERSSRAVTADSSRGSRGVSVNSSNSGQSATPGALAGDGATADASLEVPRPRENPAGPRMAATPGTVADDGAPADVSRGLSGARENPPGLGLAAMPDPVTGSAATGDVSPVPKSARENPPGPGLAASSGKVDGASWSGHVDAALPASRELPQEGPASARARRQCGAAHPPLSAAGPALAAGQRVAVATPAAPLPAPFRAMLVSTDQMARLPVEEGALPLGDLAAGSTADRPSAAASSAGPATPPAARAVPVQIAQQIAVSVSVSESGHTELRLNPEELGRVRLSLLGAEGGLTVSITAERPETADLLRRHTDSLAREFAALGYGDVGFHFEGESREDRARDHPGGQAASAPEPTLTDATDPQPPRRRIVLGGGLDLKL